MADSPSSQYSNDDLTRTVVNLPDSETETQPQNTSDEGFFDVDILIHKLQAYQASVEEAQERLRRKRSINPRQVSEVTAAARLKLRLDGRPLASSESHDNSVLSSPVALGFPSSVSSNGSSSNDNSYFDPITPEDSQPLPGTATSGNDEKSANRETWKSSHSVAPYKDTAKSHDLRTKSSLQFNSPDRLAPRRGTSSRGPTIKVIGNKSTISSPLASPAFTASEWLDVPRAIDSVTTSETGEGRKSIEQMSMCSPDEDRIRREIETYTIKDWVATESSKQLETIVSSKDPGHWGNFTPQAGFDDDENLQQPPRTSWEVEQAGQNGYGKPTFREKMGSLWHRRTKTDRIIELYYEMEENSKPKAAKTWTMKKSAAKGE